MIDDYIGNDYEQPPHLDYWIEHFYIGHNDKGLHLSLTDCGEILILLIRLSKELAKNNPVERAEMLKQLDVIIKTQKELSKKEDN